ncbi:glycosyltransferase family protein [Paraglaciecola hydrolytica]|uniref:Glycosyltransferase n=1 Tax=Paraglaciecola hydrolytica TaxID=1799789 RepID=A0A135ZZU8_9ALTE|nr:hypothetical protein [Paraglaciecola hydrolytica]KXI28501.1 hypothetical protein AX660_15535 [Paraglaciecola hydrolytica]
MNTIWCYPNKNELNRYIESNERVWKKAGYQVEFTDLLLSDIARQLFSPRKNVIILNWFEDRVSYSATPTIEFVKSLIILLTVKLKFRRIIWVRHNFCPHNIKSEKFFRWISILLNKLSHRIVTHRPVKQFKSTVIPHPLYSVSKTSICVEKDVEYIYFGTIKKYKGIEQLLSAWPSNKKIVIAGKCDDENLNKSLI